tara:strand:+ start:2170 stop:3813 length:1644 start_codon:yes stop_codon:yes gene_type:complete
LSDSYRSLIKSKFFKDLSLEKINPEFSDEFKLDQYLQKSSKVNTFDLYIRNLCSKDKENIDLILLLRCRVSHAIKGTIYSMYRSIRNKDNKTLNILFNEVLEDDGERLLTYSKSISFDKYFKNQSDNEESFGKNKNYKYVKKPFNLNLIEKLYEISYAAAKDNPKIQKGRIYPFSASIILSYGSNKRSNASISTWTKYMVERNKGIKKITRPLGYRSMTDSALVANNSESQIIKAWQNYGKFELEYFNISLESLNKTKREKIIIEIVKDIYNLFIYHYRIEKDKYRETKKRDVGWLPDKLFWKKVSPKRSLLNTNIKSVKTEKIFQSIAYSLRQKSVPKEFKEIPFEVNQKDIQSAINSFYKNKAKELDDAKENDELISFIKELVVNEAYRQTEIVIKEDMKNWKKNNTELKKWKLFSQQREFEEIHKMTGIGKPSLSKKFKFEIIAGKTAQYVIKNLKEIYYCDGNNMKTFIDQFNQTNNLKIELDKELINVFKRYLASANSKKTIFDNQEKFDDILETITRFVNPRKGTKKILSEIARDIITNKK